MDIWSWKKLTLEKIDNFFYKHCSILLLLYIIWLAALIYITSTALVVQYKVTCYCTVFMYYNYVFINLLFSIEHQKNGKPVFDLSTNSLSAKTCAVLGKVIATDRNFMECRFADSMLSEDGEYNVKVLCILHNKQFLFPKLLHNRAKSIDR